MYLKLYISVHQSSTTQVQRKTTMMMMIKMAMQKINQTVK